MTTGVMSLFNPVNIMQFYTKGRGVWTSNRIGAMGVIRSEIAKQKGSRRPGKIKEVLQRYQL